MGWFLRYTLPHLREAWLLLQSKMLGDLSSWKAIGRSGWDQNRNLIQFTILYIGNKVIYKAQKPVLEGVLQKN